MKNFVVRWFKELRNEYTCIHYLPLEVKHYKCPKTFEATLGAYPIPAEFPLSAHFQR